ncbi:Uncharacterised protein [Mycobacteroides abscessus subsp. abscessus]|nr:Uncharacterised protein [Mycobacteroides abscessus subsp. abscessus]
MRPPSCGLPLSIRVLACNSWKRRSMGLVIRMWPEPVARAVMITRRPSSRASASSPVIGFQGRCPM